MMRSAMGTHKHNLVNLTFGSGICVLSPVDPPRHTFVPISEPYLRETATEFLRFSTLYCQACGETVEVMVGQTTEIEV
jgi:hypothetical protein